MEELRRLTRADSESVLGMVANFENTHGIGADFFWPQKELQEEIWITEGFGAFREGRLTAFVLYRESADIWEITVLATALDSRREGFMEKLLRFVINAKGQKGEIWLEVHENNLSAQKLYEKLGFRQTGARPRYYRDAAKALLYSYQFQQG